MIDPYGHEEGRGAFLSSFKFFSLPKVYDRRSETLSFDLRDVCEGLESELELNEGQKEDNSGVRSFQVEDIMVSKVKVSLRGDRYFR